MEKYLKRSLETHLFFGRIMKEHALFLLAAFPDKETGYKRQADWFKKQFEQLLETTVNLANGRVGKAVLSSGEIVTEYTEKAERRTQCLTGIPIDLRTTRAQERLRSGCTDEMDFRIVPCVRSLNQKALQLTDRLISFKEVLLQEVLSGNLYTANYPLLIEHILREAKWYRQRVQDLENGCLEQAGASETEAFWNQIMMEHAEFIRGLLDPTECVLLNTANEFAKDYGRLLEMAEKQDCRMREELSRKTMETTEKYRDFKAAGAKGILECSIRSIILPLLADHVLREANHYLRLLSDS